MQIYRHTQLLNYLLPSCVNIWNVKATLAKVGKFSKSTYIPQAYKEWDWQALNTTNWGAVPWLEDYSGPISQIQPLTYCFIVFSPSSVTSMSLSYNLFVNEAWVYVRVFTKTTSLLFSTRAWFAYIIPSPCFKRETLYLYGMFALIWFIR